MRERHEVARVQRPERRAHHDAHHPRRRREHAKELLRGSLDVAREGVGVERARGRFERLALDQLALAEVLGGGAVAPGVRAAVGERELDRGDDGLEPVHHLGHHPREHVALHDGAAHALRWGEVPRAVRGEPALADAERRAAQPAFMDQRREQRVVVARDLVGAPFGEVPEGDAPEHPRDLLPIDQRVSGAAVALEIVCRCEQGPQRGERGVPRRDDAEGDVRGLRDARRRFDGARLRRVVARREALDHRLQREDLRRRIARDDLRKQLLRAVGVADERGIRAARRARPGNRGGPCERGGE